MLETSTVEPQAKKANAIGGLRMVTAKATILSKLAAAAYHITVDGGLLPRNSTARSGKGPAASLGVSYVHLSLKLR